MRPDFILPADAPKFTLLAAVAVAQAMKEIGLTAGIKWPNDILFDGKKLVGILTEMSTTADKINFIVVGLGINTNIRAEDFPPEVKDTATSLSIMKGGAIDDEQFFTAVLGEFERLYFMVKEHGFSAVLDLWRHHSVTLGRQIDVFGVNERFFGTAEDIDADGALLVKTADGLKKVLAGDVSVRNRGIK